MCENIRGQVNTPLKSNLTECTLARDLPMEAEAASESSECNENISNLPVEGGVASRSNSDLVDIDMPLEIKTVLCADGRYRRLAPKPTKEGLPLRIVSVESLTEVVNKKNGKSVDRNDPDFPKRVVKRRRLPDWMLETSQRTGIVVIKPKEEQEIKQEKNWADGGFAPSDVMNEESDVELEGITLPDVTIKQELDGGFYADGEKIEPDFVNGAMNPDNKWEPDVDVTADVLSDIADGKSESVEVTTDAIMPDVWIKQEPDVRGFYTYGDVKSHLDIIPDLDLKREPEVDVNTEIKLEVIDEKSLKSESLQMKTEANMPDVHIKPDEEDVKQDITKCSANIVGSLRLESDRDLKPDPDVISDDAKSCQEIVNTKPDGILTSGVQDARRSQSSTVKPIITTRNGSTIQAGVDVTQDMRVTQVISNTGHSVLYKSNNGTPVVRVKWKLSLTTSQNSGYIGLKPQNTGLIQYQYASATNTVNNDSNVKDTQDSKALLPQTAGIPASTSSPSGAFASTNGACQTACGSVSSSGNAATTKSYLEGWGLKAVKDCLTTCIYCGESSYEANHVNAHKKKHSEGKRFSCKFCGAGFMTSEQLNNHKKLHDPKLPYKCIVCGDGYPYRSKLVLHLRWHDESTQHRCNYCSETFVMLRDLRTHQRQQCHRRTSSTNFGGAAKKILPKLSQKLILPKLFA